MRATIEHVFADDIRWTDDDGVTTAFQRTARRTGLI